MGHKYFRARYVKGATLDFNCYTHFGIKAEILCRGFTKDQILKLEQEILELIHEKIKDSRKSGRVRDVSIERFDVKPFKDELI